MLIYRNTSDVQFCENLTFHIVAHPKRFQTLEKKVQFGGMVGVSVSNDYDVIDRSCIPARPWIISCVTLFRQDGAEYHPNGKLTMVQP